MQFVRLEGRSFERPSVFQCSGGGTPEQRKISLRSGATIVGLFAELRIADADATRCYLVGAFRDGTFNRLHNTVRIAQGWLRALRVLFRKLGSKSWIYREGARNVWVIETTCRLRHESRIISLRGQSAFVRGYFDAEGGVPTRSADRFYIQIAQKNREDLEQVREILANLEIRCGKLHNPSTRVDPDYWRFYVLTGSHRDFIRRVGSWHPRKRALLEARFKSPSWKQSMSNSCGQSLVP